MNKEIEMNSHKKLPYYKEGNLLVIVSYFEDDIEIQEEKIFNLSNTKGRERFVNDTFWAMKMGYEVEVKEMEKIDA